MQSFTDASAEQLRALLELPGSMNEFELNRIRMWVDGNGYDTAFTSIDSAITGFRMLAQARKEMRET